MSIVNTGTSLCRQTKRDALSDRTTEKIRFRAPSMRSPTRSRTGHSTGTYQTHGCHTCTHVFSLHGGALPRERISQDAPQREPRRPERRHTPNVIIVVVKSRERGCAEYDSGHCGKRAIGRPKVGRLMVVGVSPLCDTRELGVPYLQYTLRRPPCRRPRRGRLLVVEEERMVVVHLVVRPLSCE